MASKFILAAFVLVGLVATIQAAFDDDRNNRGSVMNNRDRNTGMMNSGSSMSNRDRDMMGNGNSMSNRDRDMMGSGNSMSNRDRDMMGSSSMNRDRNTMGGMGSSSSMRGMGGKCSVDKRMNQDCTGCRGKGGCNSDTCARGMGTSMKKNPENCKQWCCA